METSNSLGRENYPSIAKPWRKYYSEEALGASLPQCTAYEYLHRANESCPHDTALNYFGRKISYGQLFARIEETARALWARGVRQGDAVAVCTVNTPEFVFLFYALNRLGAVVNLIDPRTNDKQLWAYIEECGAKLVVTVDAAYEHIRNAVGGCGAVTTVVIAAADSLPPLKRCARRLSAKTAALHGGDVSWRDFIAAGRDEIPAYCAYEKDKPAIIAHTGGTTGVPKSVMLSNDNINTIAHAYRFVDIPFARGQRYFNDLPPFIIYGLALGVHTALCSGLELIIYPVFDSVGFPKLFKKYKPHHFSAVADHLKNLVEDECTRGMDMSFLITAGMGGDTLSRETEQEVNQRLAGQGCRHSVMKGYGMTELCATALTTSDSANAPGSIGIPLVNNNVKFIDTDTGEELPVGRTGEMLISGPSVMLGYLNNKEETEKTIITDADGVRWIRTGDLAHMDAEGLVYHDGRIRRIYLTLFDGQPAKIFPTLVEDAMRRLAQVSDCFVVARHMPRSSYLAAAAYVRLADGVLPSAELERELDAGIRAAVPGYMCPADYHFVDGFPRTPIGKVDFRALERDAEEYAKTLEE